MKRGIVVLTVVLLAPLLACAIKATPFSDTRTFVGRAKGMVVAECTARSGADASSAGAEGLISAEVRVERTIKGDRKPGLMKILSHDPLQKGARYLLTSMGSSAPGVDWVAVGELAVVRLPDRFDLRQLDKKTVEQQVDLLFREGLRQANVCLERVERDKQLLLKAVGGVSAGEPSPPVRPREDEHTEWVAECMKELYNVQPGMTRGDLFKYLTTEGGVSSRQWQHYVWKGCPYVKIDVELKAVDQGPEPHLNDVVTKVSNPYLQWTVAD